MTTGVISETLLLELGLSDGATDKFAQAKVYDDAGAVEATVDLDHVADGLYQGTYVPANAGHFSALYVVYDNVGRTVLAGEYSRSIDHIYVSSNAAVDVDFLRKVLTNRRETNPSTGRLDIYNDADDAVEFSIPIFEDVLATQPYRGQGVNRQDKIA